MHAPAIDTVLTGVLPATLAAADPVASGMTPAGSPLALLIPALPFASFVLCAMCAAFGIKSKLPAWLTVASLGAAFAVVLSLFLGFDGSATQVIGWEWIKVNGGEAEGGQTLLANFGLYIDSLTIYWMLFVTGLATLIALYASEYMSHDVGTGYCRFFAAFNLFVFSMACLVMGDNLLLLYLGWEGVGLCSYLLIGYFYKKPAAVAAAKKAFIVNRIGDLGLALGTYLAYVQFGTLQYDELFAAAQPYVDLAMAGNFDDIPLLVQTIPLLLMIGAFGKSAQFPLYVWLPDAMEGPTPVSALIHAATMVTAGVYLIARTFPLFLASEWALPIVAWVGTITALLAATIGMAQFDIKRIMAYSTVSQLGYMFAGLGVLTPTGGAYHVLTHAFFKALLFLCCGAVMHGFAGQLDLRKLSGLMKVKGWMIVSVGMLVGCVNLAGVPFTAGYFSKDTIIAEAFVTPGGAVIGWILLLTAGMTAYYTFRVFFRVFMGPVHYEPGDEVHDHDHDDAHGEEHAHDPGEHGDHHHGGFHPHAPGWAINTVLTVLTIASLAATGLYFVGGQKVDVHGEEVKAKHYAAAMVQQSSAAFVTPYDTHAFEHAGHGGDGHADDPGHEGAAAHGASHHVAGVGPRGTIEEPLTVLGYDPHKAMYYISGVIGLIGIGLAALLHLVGRTEAATCKMDAVAARFGPIPRWAENKWYVDEFYDFLVRSPLLAFSFVSKWIDQLLIDGLVNGLGSLPRVFGSVLRPLQGGVLHGYAIGMASGVTILLIVVILASGA